MHNSSFRWHDEIESKSRMVSGGGALPLPKIDHRNDRLNAKSENPKQNKHGHENNQPIEEQRDEPIEKMVGSIKYDTQSPWTWKESLPEDFEDSDDDGHDKSTGRRRRSRFPQIKSPTPSNSNSLANDETKDRMITYKAKPEYFLIRYSKVVRHIFSFLSFQDLDSAQSVCHHWYSSVMKEKMIRKTVESDSYAIRLKAAAVTNDAMSIDIEIEIRSFLRKIYVKPRYMIAFITWHSVTEIPEVLFQTLPRNCGTTIVASSQGLMGKKKNSKIDYHSSKGKVEGFVGIFIPKMERFSVLPFTTSAIENVRFTSSMLIKLGLKTENDQRLVKSIILFTSKLVRESTDNRAKPQKGAKSVESILEQMRKQMFSAIGHPIAFMGAPVTDIFRSAMEHNAKGIIFYGENLEARSYAARSKQDFDKLLDSIDSFVNKPAFQSFAIAICGIDNDDYDWVTVFKERLPLTRIVGLKSVGEVFSNEIDHKSDGSELCYGRELLALTVYRLPVVKEEKIEKRRRRNKNLDYSEEDSFDGVEVLQSYKVVR